MTANPASTSSASHALVNAVPPRERIAAIDVLRGVVILGILPMNIQLFATVEAAFLNPFAGPWTDTANVALWSVMHVLVGHKDLSIFAMLFGAGILMVGDRGGDEPRAAALHYRRMSILLGIGLLHAYLLWSGDILVTYAVAGMAVYPLRRWNPIRQLIMGLAAYAVPMLFFFVAGLLLPVAPPWLRDPIFAMLQPSAEAIAEHHAHASAGWLAQFPHRAASSLGIQVVILPAGLFWVAGGMMLVGMALYRWGVFFARLPSRAYIGMLGGGLACGMPFILYGLYRNFQAGWDPAYSMFHGRLYSECVQPLTALAWIAFWMLICRAKAWPWLTKPLSAVGRMALSNYLAQTLFCALVFQGFGLGWVGQVNRFGQVGLAVGFWFVQLTLSSLWLRQFSYGPAEWLWRALTYVRPPRMRPESSAGDETQESSSPTDAPSSAAAMNASEGAKVSEDRLDVRTALARAGAFAGLLLPLLGVALLAKLLTSMAAPSLPENLLLYLVASAAALLVTWVCHQVFDPERKASPIARPLRWRATMTGLAALAGLMLPALWTGLTAAAGWTHVRLGDEPGRLALSLAGGALVSVLLAIFEEVSFRGYALATLGRWNRWGAVSICGIAFVAIHLPNSGGTGGSAMLNMFLFHLAMAALVSRTGSLGPLIAFHAAWNFTWGWLLGLSVSGAKSTRGLLSLTLADNAWTNTPFGPEGGLIVTMLLGVALLLTRFLPRQGQGTGSLNG